MAEHSNIEPPPPVEGELLARAAEAFGARYKLETYSLDLGVNLATRRCNIAVGEHHRALGHP